MSDGKIMNRWLVVVGALIIQVSLGAVYIWSVFQTPLKEIFTEWSETQVTLPAQFVLAFFALFMIVGGRIQDRMGPRIVGATGGLILGAGLILARFTGSFSSGPALIWLICTFSMLGGIGIGMAYVCPLATCVKWFPDKRGLVTGLAVAGFGAGAFFFAPLARGLIIGGDYQLLGVSLFPLPGLGVFNTFMALGIIFLVAVVSASQLLKNPPAGYVPAGWTPPKPAAGATAAKVDFTPTEMLKTPMFWVLWLTFFAGCAAGLQVIMKASPIWQSFSIGSLESFPVPADLFESIGNEAAMVVSVLAIFNSLGRVWWGKLSDIIGPKNTLVIMFVVCGVVMLCLDWMRIYPLYMLAVCVVGQCFGGYLALYPALTADYYGTKHYGVNYGCMFGAFGAGGIAGPFLAGWLMKVTKTVEYQTMDAAGTIITRTFDVGDYRMAFLGSGIACLVAAVLALTLKAPKAKTA